MRKKSYIAIMLYLCFCSSVLAEEAELFPLKKLELGISSDEFQKHYPNAKLLAQEKKDENGKILEAVWICQIENNLFWDSAVVYIKDDKVKTWAYVKSKDFNQSKQNVPIIYEKLVGKLGNAHKKMVVEHIGKEFRLKTPLFVWESETRIVTFSHTQFDKYKPEDLFKCELRIMEAEADLRQRFTILKDNASEMPELFTDVLREAPEKTSSKQQPPLWGQPSFLIVTAVGIFIVVLGSVLVLRKKISSK